MTPGVSSSLSEGPVWIASGKSTSKRPNMLDSFLKRWSQRCQAEIVWIRRVSGYISSSAAEVGTGRLEELKKIKEEIYGLSGRR